MEQHSEVWITESKSLIAMILSLLGMDYQHMSEESSSEGLSVTSDSQSPRSNTDSQSTEPPVESTAVKVQLDSSEDTTTHTVVSETRSPPASVTSVRTSASLRQAQGEI